MKGLLTGTSVTIVLFSSNYKRKTILKSLKNRGFERTLQSKSGAVEISLESEVKVISSSLEMSGVPLLVYAMA